MKKSGSGFTIVELLIVVVVIAILAAITIVSYNGISQRAKNAQLLATVDGYTKALQLYKVQNGEFPVVNAGESGATNVACMGNPSDFLAESPFDAGSCAVIGSSQFKASSTLMSQLTSVSSKLPSPVLTAINGNGGQVSMRGILYANSPPTTYLQYIIPGNQDCARGTKIYNSSQYPNMTSCMIYIN